MNTMIRLMLVSMLMLVAAPAYSGPVMEIFYCAEDDEADEEELEAVVSDWLKAARTMKGGSQLEAYLAFRVVGAMGENDFTFVVEAPNLESWGAFWDGYADSPVEEVDNKFDELADCTDSVLYEVVKVE